MYARRTSSLRRGRARARPRGDHEAARERSSAIGRASWPAPREPQFHRPRTARCSASSSAAAATSPPRARRSTTALDRDRVLHRGRCRGSRGWRRAGARIEADAAQRARDLGRRRASATARGRSREQRHARTPRRGRSGRERAVERALRAAEARDARAPRRRRPAADAARGDAWRGARAPLPRRASRSCAGPRTLIAPATATPPRRRARDALDERRRRSARRWLPPRRAGSPSRARLPLPDGCDEAPAPASARRATTRSASPRASARCSRWSPRAPRTARSAQRLFMAEKTASVHVSRILAKLDVRSRTEAAAVAHRHGLAASSVVACRA